MSAGCSLGRPQGAGTPEEGWAPCTVPVAL